jgi:hypothetical protein
LSVQVFSCFLPNVSLTRTSSWAKDKDDRDFSFDDSAILIKRGVLIHGEQAMQLQCAAAGMKVAQHRAVGISPCVSTWLGGWGP